MKTITEFSGFTLKDALKKYAELSSGEPAKTPEEISQAMGEAFKLQDEKLKLFLAALEMVKERNERLKRVVVMTLAENEKAPHGAEKREEHFFLPEFFPEPFGTKKKFEGKGRHGGRDDKRKGKKRRGGRRGDRRDREGGGGERQARGDRKPRPERPQGAEGPKIVIKPKTEKSEGSAPSTNG
jgi:hypothetical protein